MSEKKSNFLSLANSTITVECNGHGIFTALLIEALKGCAADLLGNVTIGSIYAYIDKALGPWEQRPVFKTNVHEFVSLRKVNAPINSRDLKALKDLFTNSKEELPLNPSFEFTNNPD